MIQSMTGYATKTISITKGTDQKAHIAIQLKALNSRYFEVNAKLPPALSSLETELIKRFKKELLRGYIHFIVHLDNPSIFKGEVSPALGTIKSYISAIKKIKKAAEVQGEPTLEMLVRLPNVFSMEEHGLDKQSIRAIMDAAEELIAAVVKEREKEGAQLKKDFIKRIAIMHKEMATIEKRFQEHIDEKKKKLNTLTQELEGDESDLAEMRKSALYAVLDKIDIHEEIIRFQSHLENLKSLLDAPGIEKGKRLDFTLQELAREVNTITAKCADSRISSSAINIKVEIEKAREQAQNIV
jgi:uncharacterized protein (TIGR00255 family)